MKKFYSFLVAAVALVGFAACESNVEQAPVQDGMMSFVASFDNTRTELADESGVVAWCAEDTIAVSNGVETKEFSISEILEDGSAVFTGERMDGEVFTAIYPYTEETEWTVATEQEAVAGSFAHGAAVSTAVSEDGKTLSFKNECAILKFQVPADATSVAFYNGEELVVEVVGEMTVGNNYYAVVMPGTYTFTVKINGEVSKESAKALELEANKIYNLKALPQPIYYTVYVTAQPKSSAASWTKVNLYSWVNDGIGLSWPGVAINDNPVVINGYTYYAYTYSSEWNGLDVNIIINNGTDQTSDIHLGKLDKNYYVVYSVAMDAVYTEAPAAGSIEEYVAPVEKKMLYLDPTLWDPNSAWFAAYFFSPDKWVELTDTNSDGIYECEIPEGYEAKNVIFCRMNKSNHTLGWGAKWNQTGDLTVTGHVGMKYVVNAWDGSNDSQWKSL